MNKMQEVEAKFYVKDLKQVTIHLRKLKARLIQERIHEINIRFDTPNDDLGRKGRILRLRKDNEARMTFKGPSKRSEGVLTRTEIEFVVGDFERAKRLLESLGFEKLVLYEKYRTTYQLGGTHIMLDEMPYGEFIEIEGLNKESIRTVAEILDLNWGRAIAASYLAIFERFCNKRKLGINDLSFKNFKGLKISADDLGVYPADK